MTFAIALLTSIATYAAAVTIHQKLQRKKTPVPDLQHRIAAILDREIDGSWNPDYVADILIAELELTVTGTVIAGCIHD